MTMRNIVKIYFMQEIETEINTILNSEYEIEYEVTTKAFIINVIGVPLFILNMAIIITLQVILWGGDSITAVLDSSYFLLVFFNVLIFGAVAHEFLHGLGFVFFGKVSWKSVKFGVKWRYLMPYVHCRIPIHISAG